MNTNNVKVQVLPQRTYGNRARNAASRAYNYAAPRVANAARYTGQQASKAASYTVQKAGNLGRGGLRMIRNFRSTANANTLRFLLRQANIGNLNNSLPYSTLRARANVYLVSKGKPALSMFSGANTVIRRVANTLANKNKVARNLAIQAAASAALNPTQRAVSAANAARRAAASGNPGAAALELRNTQQEAAARF